MSYMEFFWMLPIPELYIHARPVEIDESVLQCTFSSNFLPDGEGKLSRPFLSLVSHLNAYYRGSSSITFCPAYF